jgi:hypothetical protein
VVIRQYKIYCKESDHLKSAKRQQKNSDEQTNVNELGDFGEVLWRSGDQHDTFSGTGPVTLWVELIVLRQFHLHLKTVVISYSLVGRAGGWRFEG